jgi:class 3 adenylate cyclase
VRHGHVFLPLDDLDNVLGRWDIDPKDRPEQRFLGKPLASNISHIIRTPEQLTTLRGRAILLKRRHFRREEQGLLCAADLAGFGTALRYAQEQMHGFGVRGEQMAELLESSVIRQFDTIFSRLGVSQVRTIGDGFMMAFPKRVFPDVAEAVTALINYWRRFLETLEQLNEDIRDPRLAVGSRMALHYGPYQYGRIGLGRSFAPTFEGARVIEVARLEQGLALEVKRNQQIGSNVQEPTTAVHRQRHVLAISDAAYEQCEERLEALQNHLAFQGRLPLDAKEFRSLARVYRLPHSDRPPGSE